MKTPSWSVSLVLLCSFWQANAAQEAKANADLNAPRTPRAAAYSRWTNGPSTDPHYFPIAVWLQNPRNAERFKAAGINLYVGLWRGPTTNQLDDLRRAGMSLICGQNKTGLENKNNPLIVGWMHGDEPDNAQSIPGQNGYGPPILPSRIVADYEKIRAADPSRPILLNLGQGVAWDNYIGRGVRRNHPDDYPEYIKGCDIASFDIYPVVHDAPEITGKLEYVAKGVERLVRWASGERIVWNCIECTHISEPAKKATPAQVRSEVWMALIHGSQGLIYFVHQFKPNFNEAALLDDPEMLAGVTAINKQIHDLAPVLNSPSILEGVELTSSLSSPNSNSSAPGKAPAIAWMQKRQGDSTYLFTVNMGDQPARASFALASLPGNRKVEVLGESRQVTIQNGAMDDEFKPYEVHLYHYPNRP